MSKGIGTRIVYLIVKEGRIIVAVSTFFVILSRTHELVRGHRDCCAHRYQTCVSQFMILNYRLLDKRPFSLMNQRS